MSMSGGIVEFSYSGANCIQIAEDLRYLISQLRKNELEPSIKDLYSRVAIVFLAFHVESLVNSLFDQERNRKVWQAEMKKFDNNSELPIPIRKLRAYYKRLFGETLSIDVSGVKDLFIIRNQIFAHAQERTVIDSSDRAKITKLEYSKFTEFPSYYRKFKTEHFEQLLTEVRDFFQKYLNLMHDHIPDWLHPQLELNNLSK